MGSTQKLKLKWKTIGDNKIYMLIINRNIRYYVVKGYYKYWYARYINDNLLEDMRINTLGSSFLTKYEAMEVCEKWENERHIQI